MADNFTPVDISKLDLKHRHNAQSTILFVLISIVTIGTLAFVLYILAQKYHAI